MPENTNLSKSRNSVVDSLRGIAILMVVLGHTMTGCTVSFENSALLNIIWSLQMPLFMVISGYVTRYSKPARTWGELGSQLWKKTKAYMLPWAVWTFVVQGFLFKEANLLDIRYLLWHMDSGYWFLISIWTIVCLYAIAQFLPLTWRCKRGNDASIMSTLAVYVLSMAFLMTIGFAAGMSFFCIKLTLYYMPFFFAGAVFGRYQEQLLAMPKSETVIDGTVACSLFIWIFLLTRFNIYQMNESMREIAIRAGASLTGCIAVCGLMTKFFELKSTPVYIKSGGVQRIGAHSLQLYLLHYLILNPMKPRDLPIFASPKGVMLCLLNWLLTVAVGMIMIHILEGSRILQKILFSKSLRG